MNISCSRSAEQLTSTISGQAWHGDSLREILEDVTAEEAQAHPVANVRSIWEIVLHLDAWVEFFSGAVRGTPIPAWATMAKAQDWPYIGIVSDEAWERCVGSLLHHHSELAEAIEAFGDARLDATVPGRTYNFNRLFQSASLHAAYHAGQIALLKKMIR